MLIKRYLLSSFLLSSLLMVSSQLYAIEPGMYVGLDILDGSIDAEDVISDNGVTFSPDGDSVTGGGLILGFASSQYFAIELGANYLNDIDLNATTSSDTGTREQYMGYFAAKPIIPIGPKFNLFARLGVGYMYIDYEFDQDSGSDYDTSNWDAYGAVGFSFTPTENFEIALAYNQMGDDDGDLSYGSLEFSYHMTTKRDSAGFLID